MPQQSTEDREESGAPALTRWRPPLPLAERLRPWIDLEEAGPDGFHAWLSTIVELLPLPLPSDEGAAASPETRIRQLSAALTRSASEQARAHFQALTYFRENQALARRLLALEAMLRTRGTPAPTGSRALDAALRRYLPEE